MTIKCFQPVFDTQEISAIRKCLESGDISYGASVEEFENKFSAINGKTHNVGFSSNSAGSYGVFSYLYDKFGECDVYASTYSFMSPAWAAKQNGHNLFFVDVDDNLLFDCEDYKEKRAKQNCSPFLHGHVEEGRKVILLPTLYGGVSNIENFNLIGDETIVLDCAHSIKVNMDADFYIYSFFPTKPIFMLHGGIVATEDADDSYYLKKFRNCGRTYTEDSYDITQDGFKFYMDNINASIGIEQLKKIPDLLERRKRNFSFYKEHIPNSLGSLVAHDPDSSYYLATLILKNSSSIDFRKFMCYNNVGASYHYPPLHDTSLFKRNYTLENADRLRDRIVNLPCHQHISDFDLEKILSTIKKYE